MKKLYIVISKTVIRCDNIPEFYTYIDSEDVKAYFERLVLEVKLGNKPKIEPCHLTVSEDVFERMCAAIKLKISSVDKSRMRFKSISLREGSYYNPMITISTTQTGKEL